VTVKVALNNHFGGFRLDTAVTNRMGVPWVHGYVYPEDLGLPEDAPLLTLRSHPRLIEAIEAVGADRAHASWHAGDSIRVVEVPDGCMTIYIDDYDGRETLVWSESEVHHA
jgi:hypothetical protein